MPRTPRALKWRCCSKGDMFMPSASGAPLLKTLYLLLWARKRLSSADRACQGQTPGLPSACVPPLPSPWTQRCARLSALLPHLALVSQVHNLCMCCSFSLFVFTILFICWREREKEQEQGRGEEREGQADSPLNGSLTGSPSQDPEIVT